jgi:thioredoxin reductase (NADPH)
MHALYDIIIIGGGPAGLTAALYACRARMKTVLIEKMLPGGQILIADTIENYPGFPEGIKGPDLAEWMFKQTSRFGLELKSAAAISIDKKVNKKDNFKVHLENSEAIEARSLIVSTGASWNALNVPGEKKLTGRGVSYCATCDGPLFKGKEVVVIGGGDTALGDALFLTKFAHRVTVIHRRGQFRATKILQERAFDNKKIEFRLNAVAVEIKGSDRVEAVEIKDVGTGKISDIKADAVFVLVGMTPNSDIIKGIVKLDEKGYILTDDDMRTSAEGIFACGDVRKKLLRQIITATGDGATAAFSAEHYVEEIKDS